MIDQRIIDKLQLRATDHQIGNSFAFGGQVFRSYLEQFRGHEVYFSECDEEGRPNHANLLYCYNPVSKLTFTVECLLDQPIGVIVDIMRHFTNRNLRSFPGKTSFITE